MSVTTELLAAESEDEYGDYLSRHPAAMIYYSLPFRDMLVALLGCRPIYGVARRADEVVGVFPLMLACGSEGDVLNSLPYFGSNGGPLCGQNDEEATSALLHWYRDHADRAASATVVENPILRQTDIPATLHTERISVVTPLPRPGQGREALLLRFDSSARRNVLKAERSGVVVSATGSDPHSLEVLAALHVISMQANGGRSKSREFFRLLPTVFRPAIDYQVYLAMAAGEAVGALLVMFHGAVAEYYMPATLPEARPIQPMAALLGTAMLDAANRGCKLWNWGGSGEGNERLIRFKMKWGGVISTYRSLTLLNDERLLTVSPDDLLEAYPGFYVRPFGPLIYSREGRTR